MVQTAPIVGARLGFGRIAQRWQATWYPHVWSEKIGMSIVKFLNLAVGEFWCSPTDIYMDWRMALLKI
jgi:hypothetical protein